MRTGAVAHGSGGPDRTNAGVAYGTPVTGPQNAVQSSSQAGAITDTAEESSTESATGVVSEPVGSGPFVRERTAGNQPLLSAAVVVAYFVLGLIAYGPALHEISSRLFGTIGDFSLWIWSMEWTVHALTHGLNPFFSNALFVPTGINLGDNTSAPLLALLATPTSLLFGPIVSANLVTVVAMPLSATSAFFVLRKWRVWRPAAALGGLVYGFSPYMIGQGIGHTQLLFVPLPPLIALTLTSIVQRRDPRPSSGSSWVSSWRLNS